MLLGFQLFITDCNGNTRIMPGDGDAGKKSPVLKKASMTLIFHGISNLWVRIMNPSSDFRDELSLSSNSQSREHGNGDARPLEDARQTILRRVARRRRYDEDTEQAKNAARGASVVAERVHQALAHSFALAATGTIAPPSSSTRP